MDPQHIPGGTARDILFNRLPNNPGELLREALYPEDSYSGETYWADLPKAERTKWIFKQQNKENARELRTIWEIFKKDPLAPLWLYFKNYAVTGLGFFVEGYVLFSVGNILTLFEAVWPQCFKNYNVCNKTWVQSVSYLEIVGIICGQIMIGFIGDWIGRRWGIIQDAVTMFVGTILLTAMWGKSLEGWVIMYAISLLVFGVGVGGEYPMTSTTAMEGVHGHTSSRDDKLHRGRSVLLAFLMQGWGQIINQGVLIILLLIFHGGGNPPYTAKSAQPTFRVSFFLVAIFLLLLIYIRAFKLPNIDRHSKEAKRKGNVTGYDIQSLRLVFRHYWHRLIGTSLSWYCNDFLFYGNQIFRNVFLTLVTSSSDEVLTIWLYNMINVGCELVGYYCAAALIDHKLYGRKRMQCIGFMMNFILFIIVAAIFPLLNVKGPGGHAFMAIYFVSSFWTQFGSNCTTFLIAGEIYPGSVRATAHGMSAATGKLGALTATVLYNYIGNRTKFWVVTWFALIGSAVTLVFIPDTTGLDLREQERYWQFVREGREQEYHGVAIHPRHLSWFERLVLKRDRGFDAAKDKDAKVEELRQSHVEAKRSSVAESESQRTITGDSEVDEKVSKYFEWESKNPDAEELWKGRE